ncbi:unnamed protein product, partial [marine sediment metagenome]
MTHSGQTVEYIACVDTFKEEQMTIGELLKLIQNIP